MSDDPTRKLDDGDAQILQQLFEMREMMSQTLERLERLEVSGQATNERLERLEAKSYDTKPIWERALMEILEVKQHVINLEYKVDTLNRDMLQMRADVYRLSDRVDGLERKAS